MNSKDVSRAIRQVIRPALVEHGFDDFTSRKAWRHWDEGVDVIEITSFNAYVADGVGCTTFSFGIALGVYLSYLLHPALPPRRADRPNTVDCDARRWLEKRLSQPYFRPYETVRQMQGRAPREPTERPDVWYVQADGSNLDTCIADALAVIKDEGLPWIDRMHNPDEFLLELDQGASFFYGAPGSPHRTLLEGLVFLRLGRYREAHTHLMRARDTERFTDLLPPLAQAIDRTELHL